MAAWRHSRVNENDKAGWISWKNTSGG